MIKSNSLECQDLFVYSLLGHQKYGYFLDIGCQTPIDASNTYLFETLGWSGLAFDRSDLTHWNNKNVEWYENRKTPRFLVDATTAEFTQILKDNVPKDTIVDYISLDIDDNGGKNYALEGLLRIINAGIIFKIMTLEHEAYKQPQPFVKNITRIILHTLGYRALFSDVIFPNGNSFEDWWINPKYFPTYISDFSRDNIVYTDCIKVLEDYRHEE